MHLERNLTPAMSKLYIVSGIFMIIASLLMLKLLGIPLAIAFIVGGVVSIASGCLHH